MSLDRTQLLKEMGISPVWRLRQPSGADVEPAAESEVSPAAEAVSASVAVRTETHTEVRAERADAPVVAAPGSIPVARDLGWDELQQAVADCRSCVLCEKRQQAVLGVGDRQADWLFIGEGPGADEDAKGEPFVGQAGKLLDAMLAAIDLRRGEGVYIANAVKCRPPGNRTPEPEEMATCWPYLQRQIALIKPKVIVLLGRAAVHAVLKEERSLAALRGQRFEYFDGDLRIPVFVTYHPAYLLRNLPDKSKTWEDLCLARRAMREIQAAGLDLPF